VGGGEEGVEGESAHELVDFLVWFVGKDCCANSCECFVRGQSLMSHDPLVNDSSHTREGVMPLVGRSRDTHVKESCHTCEGDSQFGRAHDQRADPNESCQTCEGVISLMKK